MTTRARDEYLEDAREAERSGIDDVWASYFWQACRACIVMRRLRWSLTFALAALGLLHVAALLWSGALGRRFLGLAPALWLCGGIALVTATLSEVVWRHERRVLLLRRPGARP